MKKTIILFLILPLFTISLLAQRSYFSYTEVTTGNGPEYHFKPDYQAIQADYPIIPGHPDAGYRYFWIFGDGNYSFEDEPVHKYKTSGNYEISFSATPIYSPTEPPPTSNDMITNAGPNLIPSPGVYQPGEISIDKNRRPVPKHSNIYIVSYKNTTNSTIQNGAIHFYYKASHFNHILDYLQNGETFVQETAENHSYYDTRRVFQLGSLAPGETKTLFIELEATLATVASGNFPDLYLKAELINGFAIMGSVEINDVAASGWDPNQISFTDPDQIAYDQWPSDDRVNVRIDFENEGTSTVTHVSASCEIPHLLDFSSVSLVDYYPKDVEPVVSLNELNRQVHIAQSGITLHGTKDPTINSDEPEFNTEGYYILSIDLLDRNNYNPSLFPTPSLGDPYCRIPAQATIKMDFGQAFLTNTAHLDFYTKRSFINEQEADLPSLITTLSPNPSTGMVMLERADALEADLHVFNWQGKQVALYKLEKKKTVLNLQHLSQGEYLLVIQDKSGKIEDSQKLLIHH